MDCISNDEARQMDSNRISDKVAELEETANLNLEKAQQLVNELKVIANA